MPDADVKSIAGAALTPTQRFIAYFARLGTFTPNAKAYLIGSFLMGIGHGAVWVHMNLYYRALGLGEQMIGRILSAGSFGMVLVAVPAAMWVDRFPAQRIFGLAAIGFSLFLGLQLFIPRPEMFLVASALSAGLFTVHAVAAAPFFMRNATPEERIYLFGFANAVETCATIVAALGVGFLARTLAARMGSELTGLRVALSIAALVSLCAAFAFARIRGGALETKARAFKDYIAAKDLPLLLKLTVPALLVGLGAGLIIPFLNLYFRDRFGQDARQIGVYFAVSQALTVVGFLLGPPIARRMGSVAACVLTELLSIPFFLVLAFARSLPLAVMAFWMRGALMNMNQPISQNFAMETVPPDQQTVANSVRMLGWNLSWMVSTQLGGWIIEKYGFTPPMLVAIVLYAVSASLFWVFFGAGRGRRPVHSPAAMNPPQ